MGIFNFFGSHSRTDDSDLAIAPGTKDGKIYKLVQLLAISVFLVAVVLVVFEIFQILDISATGNGVILSIGVIGLGGLTALPWLRVFEGLKEKPFKIVAIVFLSIIGVCVILWIVCVWLIVGLIKNFDFMNLAKVANSLNAIRASLIVSLQFIITSTITMNVVKYRKTLLPYQIMYGVALAFIDVWFTIALFAFSITKDGFTINEASLLFTNKWMWAFLVIAIVLMSFPSYVFRRADKRRMLEARSANIKEDLKEILAASEKSNESNTEANDSPAPDSAAGEPVEEKLKKIKALLDGGLITQEEYDAKRAEILNNI